MDAITEAQLALPPSQLGENRTRRDYLRCARWWQLEATRGYVGVVEDGETSSDRSRRYAANMRWAAELAREFGPGTWLELKAKVEDVARWWRSFSAAWGDIGKRARRDLSKMRSAAAMTACTPHCSARVGRSAP